IPIVHRADPEDVVLHVEDFQLQEWRKWSPRSTALVEIYDQGFPTNLEARLCISVLADAIRAVTGCWTVEIAAPIPKRAEDGSMLQPPPACYFVYNISRTAVNNLKRLAFWRTETISFFVYDLSPTIPTLLFTLEGFTHCRHRALLETVRRALHLPQRREHTMSLALENPEFQGMTEDAIHTTILDSVRISFLELYVNGPLLVNVYCRSPTTSVAEWRMWRDALGDLAYVNPLCRAGQRLRWLRCSGCHGADHFRRRCPFAGTPIG
ncbi:hypothetical protein BV20DRAFT_903418, partial [Pilatotrama ljubarskyi]